MTATDTWSGRLGFILATIGSAVGIGSIWKFPYELGANGGSTFLLFYLLGLVVVVVPLMLAEFAIGRHGGGDPATSLAEVAAAAGAGRGWRFVGILGVATGFLILTFYSVIGGWTLGHALETLASGLPASGPDEAAARFRRFLSEPLPMLGYHAAFMACAALIVMRGVAGGIEAASMVLMPLLMVLMLALVGYACAQGDLAQTIRFLFTIDLQHVDARTALEALGLGFFSIGVGLGLMITYAAYAGLDIGLTRVAIVSVVADTAISLLAGFAVFPIVFAHGLDPASGPGLVFVTLPLAFANMPFGAVAAITFFLLLFVAALASAISLLEIVVAMLVRRLEWSRPRATWLSAAVCFAGGIPTALSFNRWSEWFPLGGIPGFEHATFFDLIDDLTSNVLLPAGGLAIALFAGWVMSGRQLGDALALRPWTAALLRVSLRYLVPAGIALAGLAPFVFGR